MNKAKKDLIPCSDPALIGYLKAERDSKERLIKRIQYLEARMRNVETFLDGSTRFRLGKFVKIDLEHIDNGDTS